MLLLTGCIRACAHKKTFVVFISAASACGWDSTISPAGCLFKISVILMLEHCFLRGHDGCRDLVSCKPGGIEAQITLRVMPSDQTVKLLL